MKRQILKILVSAVFLLAGDALLAGDGETPAVTAPLVKGQRIYASHHSYFVAIPALLTELAKAGGYTDQVIVGSHYIGGSKSLQHWNLPDTNNVAKAALKAGKVDVFILTPVYLPDAGIEKFAQLGLTNNPEIRVTVMEFWLPFDVYNPAIYQRGYTTQPGEPPLMPKPAKVNHHAATVEELRQMHAYYFQTMDAYIASVNRQLGKPVVFVVPMGQAVLALREKIVAGTAPGLSSQDDLFADDLGHPTLPMQALEAYCHYAVIYRKNPVGLPTLSVLRKMSIAPEQRIALNRLLQELAWSAVTSHPLSGVRAP